MTPGGELGSRQSLDRLRSRRFGGGHRLLYMQATPPSRPRRVLPRTDSRIHRRVAFARVWP